MMPAVNVHMWKFSELKIPYNAVVAADLADLGFWIQIIFSLHIFRDAYNNTNKNRGARWRAERK